MADSFEEGVMTVEAPTEALTGWDVAPRRWPRLLVAGGAALTALALVLIPPDATLGGNIRAVFFHGAVTWTGIILAAISGLVGIGSLVSRRDTRLVWRLYSLATLCWVLSLSMSFPVMRMTWGGVLWNEPKLLMTAEVVSVFLLGWAIALFSGRTRVAVIVAVVAFVIMAVLLAVTPAAFHPDNPIFRSGNLRFIGTFLAVLVGLLAVAAGIAAWPRRSR